MHHIRKFVPAGTLAAIAALGVSFLPATAAAQPQLTIQQEEQAHPRLAKAIHELKETVKLLEEAPDDFGGNKAAAIRDCRQAIHSLKKALYYRLKMDDAAIDRVQ